MSATNYSIAPYLMRPAGGVPGKPAATLRVPWTQTRLGVNTLAVLRRQWRVIATTLGVLVGVTALYCLLAQPRYRARSTVLIEARGPELLSAQRFGEVESPFGSSKYDYYQTQFYLLRSPGLAARVIDELDLVDDPRFVDESLNTTTKTAASHGGTTNPALIQRYLNQLTIQPVRGTRVVGIEFESPDPTLAADVANAHARVFVSAGLERLYQAMEQIRSFLQGKLRELQGNMQKAEADVLNFQSDHHLLPVELRKDVASERLMDLSRRLTEAEAHRIVLEAEYRFVKRGEMESLPAVLTDPHVQKLREDYNRLELQHALLAAKWRPTYPALRQLESQLDYARGLLNDAIAKVAETVKTKYLTAKATTEDLQKELDVQRVALLSRQDAEGELLTLTREAETTRALYDNLLAQAKELDVVGGADISNMSIAENAAVPSRPSSPNARVDLLLSLITGLLLGTGLAFLRDSLDHTVRDASDVHRATGLGTLAIIPEFDAVGARAGRKSMLSLRKQRIFEASLGALVKRNGAANHKSNGATNGVGHGALNGTRKAAVAKSSLSSVAPPRLLAADGVGMASAEAFRTLRTSLLLNRSETPPRVIVIASAVDHEGKTTTAVNTAASLANCGASVLLVDGDLRVPRCHEALGLPLEPGLSGYLAGVEMTQPIQGTRVRNLSFLAAGRPVQNPAELLTSWRMWQLLKGARDHFDFVVIDSPPLLAVSDGLLLANVSDGVVLVVESKRSREEQLHAAMSRLDQTGAVTLGAVLNRSETEKDYYRDGWAGTNGLGSDAAKAEGEAHAAPAQG